MAWLTTEKEWTTEKGKSNNNLASNTVPLLDRAAPPAGTADSGGGGGSKLGGIWPAPPPDARQDGRNEQADEIDGTAGYQRDEGMSQRMTVE